MINCRPVHGVRRLSRRDPEFCKWEKKDRWRCKTATKNEIDIKSPQTHVILLKIAQGCNSGDRP